MTRDEAEREERDLRGILCRLEREYREKAEPYLKRLCALENLKPPPPITSPDGRVFFYNGPSCYGEEAHESATPIQAEKDAVEK